MLRTTALVLFCCGMVSGQWSLWVDQKETVLDPLEAHVPRCCPFGRSLSPDVQRKETLLPADITTLCTKEFDEQAWKPHIYNLQPQPLIINLDLYSEEMSMPWPRFFSRTPKCAKLQAQPWGNDIAGLMSDSGRLQVFGKWRSIIPLAPERFCADAEVALVCEPDVFQCCRPEQVIDGVECDESYIFYLSRWNLSIPLHQLLQSKNGSVGVAWPACADDWQLEKVGELDKASYKGNGVLQLWNIPLKRGEWCAGGIRGSSNIGVFACVPRESEEARKFKDVSYKVVPMGIYSVTSASDESDGGNDAVGSKLHTCIPSNALLVSVGVALFALVTAVLLSGYACWRVNKMRTVRQ